MFTADPFTHARAADLCPACGAPDLPGFPQYRYERMPFDRDDVSPWRRGPYQFRHSLAAPVDELSACTRTELLELFNVYRFRLFQLPPMSDTDVPPTDELRAVVRSIRKVASESP